MASGRLPPQNEEAERSILGALLLDEDAIVQVVDNLRGEHFYHDRHKKIYQAIYDLFERREPVDMITVTNELQTMGALEEVGGASYLAELVNSVPTSAHASYYSEIVRECAAKRRLISVAGKISELGFKEESEADELIDQAEQELFSIAEGHFERDFSSVGSTLEVVFDQLDDLYKSQGGMRGVPTGLESLDDKLAGLQDSNLIILAARPSVGKTSLAINIAQHAAVENDIPVGIFSLETSKEQLVYRMLSAQADVDGWRLTTGNLESEDFQRIGEAMGVLNEAPIFIDDTPGANVMEMRTKARKLQLEHGIRLIIVDYLQLAHGRGLENRVQEVSEISQAFKNLARELNVPVLALSQLSRAVEGRTSPRPQLSDLRASGSIEQDADVVMFLFREDEEDRSGVNLYIAKHRNGPTGEINLYFRGERTKFYEVEDAD
ncbi:MAG: replicative DNA helicase [Patescibacteria group bacterium]